MSTSALAAPRPQPLVLSEHRMLRFVVLFLLYLAQGLPFGLIQLALPAWLAQNGASAAAIGGLLAMVLLPWTFKLAYGCIMDRYAYLPMGRRRPWIIAGQTGLVIALLAMAVANPGADQIGLLTAMAFAIGLTSAVQDVAVDGLAVDVLPAHEIERVNGFMFGGQAIGMAAGAMVSGLLIAHGGIAAAALAQAAMVGAILILIIAVRERPHERLLPWTPGEATRRNQHLHVGAFGPIVRRLLAAMFTRQTLLLIPGLMAVAAAQGIFTGLAPLFGASILDWGETTYSSWGGQAKFVAGVAGGILFGIAAARWGARRMFIASALLYMVAAGIMLLVRPWWGNPAVLVTAIFAFSGVLVLRMVAAGSLAMRLCSPEVAATQFAVFMAILNLGATLGSASLGWLDAVGGITAMFAALGLCGLLAAVFGYAAKVGR